MKTTKIIMNVLSIILIAIVILPISIKAYHAIAKEFGCLFSGVAITLFWIWAAAVVYLFVKISNAVNKD
jgi:hypothetical protein